MVLFPETVRQAGSIVLRLVVAKFANGLFYLVAWWHAKL